MSKPNRFKTALIAVAVCLGIFFLLSIAAWMLGVNSGAIKTASEKLNAISIYLMLIRCLIVFVVWYFWKNLCCWLLPENITGAQEKREAFFSYRNKFVIGFIVIELLIVQNLLGRAIGVLL